MLVHITDADDSDQANAAYETSSLPIDIEHHAMLSECLCERLQLRPSYRCTAAGDRKREGAAIMVIPCRPVGSPRARRRASGSAPWRRRAACPTEFARQDWYDLWYPNLAPSVETMKLGQQATTPAEWAAFVRKYRAEMATPENSHSIALLAALAPDQLLGRLLLRARVALPPLGAARELLARRARTSRPRARDARGARRYRRSLPPECSA